MNGYTDYAVPTDEELISLHFLDKLASRLGNPPDIDSAAGLKVMDAVIAVWQKHFPEEANDWIHDRKVDLANEKSLADLTKDQVGLYNPVGYPKKLYELTKTMFPGMKLQKREVWKKLIKIYPNLFKTSNYA